MGGSSTLRLFFWNQCQKKTAQDWSRKSAKKCLQKMSWLSRTASTFPICVKRKIKISSTTWPPSRLITVWTIYVTSKLKHLCATKFSTTFAFLLISLSDHCQPFGLHFHNSVWISQQPKLAQFSELNSYRQTHGLHNIAWESKTTWQFSSWRPSWHRLTSCNGKISILPDKGRSFLT